MESDRAIQLLLDLFYFRRLVTMLTALLDAMALRLGSTGLASVIQKMGFTQRHSWPGGPGVWTPSHVPSDTRFS